MISINKFLPTFFLILTSSMYPRYVLMGILAFLFSCLIQKSKFKLSTYLFYEFIFASFIFASYFWLEYKNIFSLKDSYDIIFGFVSIILFIMWIEGNCHTKEDIKSLLKIYIISRFFLLIIVSIITIVTGQFDLAFGEAADLNRNAFGLGLSWALVFMIFFSKNKNVNTIYCNPFLMIVLLFGIILTGSRKSLLLVLVCYGLHKIIYEGPKKIIKNIFLFFTMLGITVILLINVNFLYNIIGFRIEALINDLLGVDSIEEGSILERAFYIQTAVTLFKDNIILGNGHNSFFYYLTSIGYWHPAYSHCNYVELLTNQGIVGFLIYYAYKIKQTATLLKFNYNNRDILGALLLSGIVVSLVFDYGMVSYYDFLAQFIFILSFTFIKIYYEEKCKSNKKYI